MLIGYAVMAAISLLLILLYQTLIKKKEFWLGLLFVCVAVVNLGYLMLSLAGSVGFAIFANDVAYFGSVFLSMCMFLTIIKLCGVAPKRWLIITLLCLAGLMFLIVATSGFLPWYYRSLSIERLNGVTVLVKEYGVLHSTYMVYLAAYFVAMIAAIMHSVLKKRGAGQKFAGALAVIVLINLFVWFFEKFGDREFEFLSISYVVSEVLFVLLYWMMQDYVHKNDLASTQVLTGDTERARELARERGLTAKECEVLERMLQGESRKQIAAELHVSENTVKTHVKHIYEKLDVGGREEIQALLS